MAKYKIYYKRCATCNYMRKNPGWYKQLKKTSFFTENSPETPLQFYNRTQPPMGLAAFYKHMKNHTTLAKEKMMAQTLTATKPDLPVFGELIEGGDTDYVQALDDTIRKFHTQIRDNQIQLTLTGGLQAIKIRADIEKANKDRKLDAFKAFSGMAKHETSDG